MAVDQQHHEVAMLAAQAARERCHSTGPGLGLQQSMGMSPSTAGKAVTDAYTAALAILKPPPAPAAKAARKAVRKSRG